MANHHRLVLIRSTMLVVCGAIARTIPPGVVPEVPMSCTLDSTVMLLALVAEVFTNLAVNLYQLFVVRVLVGVLTGMASMVAVPAAGFHWARN